ncbi:hypothetical protein SRHO_G00042080 [Serrasalmus rhombeus]
MRTEREENQRAASEAQLTCPPTGHFLWMAHRDVPITKPPLLPGYQRGGRRASALQGIQLIRASVQLCLRCCKKHVTSTGTRPSMPSKPTEAATSPRFTAAEWNILREIEEENASL